ncbi:hypothetical protein NI17_010085 [Thermobifida halotolerans]|uniref:CRISPR-associated protein n=1 Tax=Thermobifida halotolerans TaxID=483545 RepID=A0AA97M092_9ACTN|nr:hypothetical protein [Thermobifida halotolerans]UOE21425.1 hypothetical protein NI17_010085 [Thermobifida halotolerans]
MTVHVISVGLSLVDFFESPDRDEHPLPTATEINDLWQQERLGLDELGQRLEEAFGMNASEESEALTRFQELAEEVEADRWAGHHGLSAELDTLRTVADTPLPPTDTAFLITSDTKNGHAAAVWTAIALAAGDASRVCYLPDITEETLLVRAEPNRVYVVRIPGLDAASDTAFHAPMERMGRLGRLLVGGDRTERFTRSGEPVHFHLSGGYRATTPYLIALAEWLRSLEHTPGDVSAWVLPEDAKSPFRVPLRRLRPEWVRNELAGFNPTGWRAQPPTDDLLEGYAYEPSDTGVRLTAFGAGMRALFGVNEEPVAQ